MTVAELDRRMTAREYAKWRLFATIEPFGDRTHHLMMAQLTALLFNVNRGKKSDPVMGLYDFDLFEGRADKENRKEAEERQARKEVLDSFRNFKPKDE